jgi:hypothetical protein
MGLEGSSDHNHQEVSRARHEPKTNLLAVDRPSAFEGSNTGRKPSDNEPSVV